MSEDDEFPSLRSCSPFHFGQAQATHGIASWEYLEQ